MKPYSFAELKNETLQVLGHGLGEHQFTFHRKQSRFVRQMSTVRWSVGISFIRHPTDFDVTAGVAVGFDALEKLICEDEREAMRTYSLGVNLGYFTGEGQKRWSVHSEQDVEPTCGSLMKTIVEMGLPYLEKYSSMTNALELLSGDDAAAWRHSPIHYARAQRAIGLAFLLGDENAFHRLAVEKTEFLTKREDQMLQRFLDVRKKLEALLHPKTQV